MIFRFLQSSNGGWVHRYIQFRWDIMTIYRTTGDSIRYYPPITLFDFTRPHDYTDAERCNEQQRQTKKKRRYNVTDQWRISDDRVIGGYSESYLDFIIPEQHSPQATDKDIIVEDDTQNKVTAFEGQEPDSTKAESETTKTTKPMETTTRTTDSTTSTTEQQWPLPNLPRPFLRWYGTIDTTVGLTTNQNVQRSGFAAIRSPEFTDLFGEGANLRGMYNALEIIARSSTKPFPIIQSPPETSETTVTSPSTNENDQVITERTSTTPSQLIPRTFTINLKVSTAIPDDMFQTTIRSDQLIIRQLSQVDEVELNLNSCSDENETAANDDDPNLLDIDKNSFVQIVVPFRSFRVATKPQKQGSTSRIGASVGGALRELDDTIKIESIGFVIKDGIDGDFIFDLARIRAVNVVEDDVKTMERTTIYDPNQADDTQWIVPKKITSSRQRAQKERQRQLEHLLGIKPVGTKSTSTTQSLDS